VSTIQEKQLGQLRPTTTSAEVLYSPAAATTWVGKSLFICNTSAAVASFSVFHDEDATTYDQTTALFYQVVTQPKETVSITSLLAGFTSTGNVAVQSSVASALTFTLYGADIT